MQNEYLKDAKDFLQKTNTQLIIEFKEKNFYFNGDKEKRNIYLCTLKRGSRVYTFTFGDSIYNSNFYQLSNKINDQLKYRINQYGIENFLNMNNEAKRNFLAPYSYNPLKSILEKYEKIKNEIIIKTPSEYDILASLDIFDDDFIEFCNTFGYSEDSINAKNIFDKVIDQTKNLKIIFTDDEIEILQNIN